VCIFSGTCAQISDHLAAVVSFSREESCFAIDWLIKQSCFGSKHETVQQLCQLNEQRTRLMDDTLKSDGEFFYFYFFLRNRAENNLFSMYSVHCTRIQKVSK